MSKRKQSNNGCSSSSSSTWKKGRLYSTDFLQFGFIPDELDKTKPYCLLCSKSLCADSMNRDKLKKHMDQRHGKYKDKPLQFFKDLKCSRGSTRQQTIRGSFSVQNTSLQTGLKTSYELSWLIAKRCRPHTDGETFLKPALEIYHQNMVEKGSTGKINSIPLSDDSVRRRIDITANDVKRQLIDILKTTVFSMCLDETTVKRSHALLMAYVRFQHDGKFVEEMLFCQELKSTTRAKDILEVVLNFFNENDIPLQNMISIAADGAPAMMGKNNGFFKLMKDRIPSLMTIHCVIHRENLAASGLGDKLHSILSKVVEVVNWIKTHPKKERIFAQFCQDQDESFIQLILHTKIRWLSRGNCLERFVQLYDAVLEFCSKDKKFGFLKDVEVKPIICYLADIFHKLNALNKMLQGSGKTLIDCQTSILGFIDKLKFLKAQVSKGRFSSFPHLVTSNPSSEIVDLVSEHLNSLEKEMTSRFEDLKALKFPSWITQPFLFDLTSDDAINMELSFVDELSCLRNDQSSKVIFGVENKLMWLNNEVADKYPCLAKAAAKILLPFPTTYLVECAFSTVTDILTGKRSSLDICERGDLRARLTNFTPCFSKLAAEQQAQGAH